MRGWPSHGLAVVALVGCGRIDFGSQSGADAAPDAPPLPAIVCARAAIPVAPVPADADLAMAGMNTDGLVALWASTAGSQVIGLRIANTLVAIGEPHPVADAADAIGGAADSTTNLLAVVRSGNSERVLRIDRDLASTTPTDVDGNVLGREPIAGEQTGLIRGWLRGSPTGVVMSYVDDDGSIGAAGTFATANPVTAIASDDGPDHAHIVWRERIAEVRRCTAADVDLGDPMYPVMGGSQVITDDCEEVRNASGPPAADSMIIVWRTAVGQLFAKYIASTGDVDTALSLDGRAVKVKFDGTRFWVTWIAADGVLWLAQLELDGSLTSAPLPGRAPAGDEAFELVRHRGRVYLAILSPGELELLETCAS